MEKDRMNDEYLPKTPLDVLTVTLAFTVSNVERSFSHKIPLPRKPDDEGIALAATETFAEIEKDIRYGAFYEQLPDPAQLQAQAKRSYTPEQWMSEERLFLQNTQEVWHEITNTLFTARYLLAQSRAYKDVELLMIKEGADHRGSEVLNVHLSKMNAFDGAVYRLAKIEDLFLLLLFVNLGNSLVDVNLENPDWEKN